MVFHSQDAVCTCLRAVLAASFPPVCLLIEILIEISEGDFNHKGVVRAYLSEPQRKKEFSSRRCHPSRTAASVREKCALRHISPVHPV